MRITILVCMMFFACKGKVVRPNFTKAELDTLVWQMNRKINYEHYVQPSLDSMRNYLVRFEDSVKLLDYDKLTFYYLLNKAEYLQSQKQDDSVNSLVKRIGKLMASKDISRHDILQWDIAYNGILLEQGFTDSALKVAHEAYYLAREVDTSRIAQTSLDLARIYQTLDDLPSFRKYMFEAWAHSYKEPELKAFIASGVAYYYDRVNAYDSAMHFIEQSEKDSFLVNKPEDHADNYANRAIFLLKKGALEEGLTYQLKAKAIYDSLGIKNTEIYINLAQTYSNLNEFSKAVASIDTARLLAQAANDHFLLRFCWYSKAAIHARFLHYKEAYYFLDSAYRQYSLEVDSSLREQARELETQYAVREKDNRIQTLALTNQASEKIRSQQRTIIFILIAFALLAAVTTWLLIRRRRLQTELRESNLRWQLLRTQLEPHFLFNSLGILQSMVRRQQTDDAVGYLSQLGRLIRFHFETASENFVLLRDEVEALKSYLHLQAVYHPGLFDYKVTAYEGYEEDPVYVPPMLLQPFVENAIKHGFSGLPYKGELTVQLQKSGSRLHCLIEDNGRGPQGQGEEKNVRSTAINQERLSLLERQTGEPAKLAIIEKPGAGKGSGIRVEIDMPLRTQKT